jgi:DNA-binding MurR/RpiR family transcriptional regulator
MENILLKVRESYSDFNNMDQKIASYILENRNDILQLSIGQIAENCGTSEAAIVRFCKLMGLNGFKEFKRQLTADMLNSRNLNQEDIAFSDIIGNEDIHKIVRDIVKNNTSSILETQKLIDYELLEKVICLIANASRVDFYGVGASGLVALDAQQKFIRIGKNCNANIDPHIQITLAANLSPGDVAVAISYSGTTKDILETVTAAKSSGAHVIAITRYGTGNPLISKADITLFTTSPEISVRSGSMSSRIAQLTMIDIIFVGVASLNPKEYFPKLEKTHNYANMKKQAK